MYLEIVAIAIHLNVRIRLTSVQQTTQLVQGHYNWITPASRKTELFILMVVTNLII